MWHLGYHDIMVMKVKQCWQVYWVECNGGIPYVGFDYHYKKEGGPKNIFGNEEKNWFGQASNKNNRKTVVAGIAYTLPMLVIADARVDGRWKISFSIKQGRYSGLRAGYDSIG